MAPPFIPLKDRFWSKVVKTDTCWIWIGAGSTSKKGYGQIRLPGAKGRQTSAHRVSWILHRGEIPIGLDVLHKCDNPPCVNPDHLFLGTNQDNVNDKVSKGRQYTNRDILGRFRKGDIY